MRITVCLQTCNRLHYTERTVRTFATANPDLSRFDLIHGDDGSTDWHINVIAQAYGFTTVLSSSAPIGPIPFRAKLMDVARQRGAEWVLMLENDIESLRAFPFDLFDYIRQQKDIYCLRLFGAFKDAAGTDACLTVDKWRKNATVKWQALVGAPEPCEVGQIHWTPQPTLTRMAEAWAIHHEGARPALKTARVVNNVMGHIGLERTQDLLR